MDRFPQPEGNPSGPFFEGRPLARPDEELVDQGAAFDIATLLTRRRVLGLFGAGVGALAVAACGGSGSGRSEQALGVGRSEIPEETNGPFPADGTEDLNILQESGIVRRDLTTSLDGGETVPGVPLTFNFSVFDMSRDNAPYVGAAVYVWHCDAIGRYSMYSEGVQQQTWLRGMQFADESGRLSFETIVPGCYPGRWPHIHFEVYPDAAAATNVDNAIATSQLAFPPEMLGDVYALTAYGDSARHLSDIGEQVTDDVIFAGGNWKSQVATMKGDVNSGFTGS
ncbi:MAG TPA: 3,4-dioxygenase subunit beta, partial [Marmoricola sp.]|nr:3,4-dioxygenase subunit beta [Marmoricola sp.]